VRDQLTQQLGRPLTQPEVKKLFRSYEANLVELGFEQDDNGQWVRTRSSIERLLG
jgi:hypothetical protein